MRASHGLLYLLVVINEGSRHQNAAALTLSVTVFTNLP